MCVCLCAITSLAALRRLIQPCYLGGNPYGRRQSDVDGITATLVLMRSSLDLMSDRMTVGGGPHGSQPDRQGTSHICRYMHTINVYTNTHMRHTCVDAGLILEVAAIFHCPLTPVILHWLTTIHKHKHRFIELCLKSESSLKKIWGTSELWTVYMAPRPDISWAKMLCNH